TLTQVVVSLAQRQVAALGVVGLIHDDARSAAEQHGVPLFRLPDDCDLRDTERDVIRLIVEREAQLERRGSKCTNNWRRYPLRTRG
ncbi:MAG: hypothetical protein MUQ10_05420, partial [Anaerolineae bacterium]|nr:hypothetical protein [Anaerolineae bacterium]